MCAKVLGLTGRARAIVEGGPRSRVAARWIEGGVCEQTRCVRMSRSRMSQRAVVLCGVRGIAIAGVQDPWIVATAIGRGA